MKLTVTDREGNPVNAAIEIKKWENGKPVFSRNAVIRGPNQVIEVPDTDDVEITADADGYVPKKKIVSRDEQDASIPLDRIEKGKSIVVDNIYFETNEAYLLKESLNILDRMIDGLKHNPKIRIEIRGHTDSTGTREHNMKLSERRAFAVRDYMIKNGISPGRFETAGMGPDKPVAENNTSEGRRKNRRTEFYILDK
jgi:outer membrane protein OmpA-like peptidoglycan-associated protein